MPTLPPPTTLPALPPATGSNPFIKFGDPAKAPTLEYNLPQQTSFRVDYHRPLYINPDYFGPEPAPAPVVQALEAAQALPLELLTEKLRRELIGGQGELLGGGELIRAERSAVQVDMVQLPTRLITPSTTASTESAGFRAATTGSEAAGGVAAGDYLAGDYLAGNYLAGNELVANASEVRAKGVDSFLGLPQLAKPGKVPLAKAAAEQVRVAGVPLDYIAQQIKGGKLPQVYQKFSGATALRFLDLPEQPRPQLTMVQHIVVRSYLGNYGAGKVVNTFSLLPGERTSITVKSYRDQNQTESVTAASSNSAYANSDLTTSANSSQSSVSTRAENALDSFSEASASELERMVAEETGQARNSEYGGFSTNGAYGNTTNNRYNSATQNASAGGGGRVNIFGLVSFGGGGGSSGSSTSGGSTTTSNGYSAQSGMNYGGGTSEMTKALNSALDRHVAQSAQNRQVQVNTTTGQQTQSQAGTTGTSGSGGQQQTTNGRQQTNSLVATDENLNVRELANLNQSRTLNFVFRQMQQEFVTLTYLDDVSFVFSDGYPGRTREIKLPDLRAFLVEVLVEEAQVSEVLQQVLRMLFNIQDYRHQPVRFAQRIEETLTVADLPGLPPLDISYYAKRPDLYERTVGNSENTYGLFHVPGIILDVTSRVLPTDSLLVDSVLGQGEALDYYNLSLQEEAVQQARRENERLAADTETQRQTRTADQAYRAQRLALAETIVNRIPDPVAQAEAFHKMLGECCDEKLLALLRERDTL